MARRQVVGDVCNAINASSKSRQYPSPIARSLDAFWSRNRGLVVLERTRGVARTWTLSWGEMSVQHAFQFWAVSMRIENNCFISKGDESLLTHMTHSHSSQAPQAHNFV